MKEAEENANQEEIIKLSESSQLLTPIFSGLHANLLASSRL